MIRLLKKRGNFYLHHEVALSDKQVYLPGAAGWHPKPKAWATKRAALRKVVQCWWSLHRFWLHFSVAVRPLDHLHPVCKGVLTFRTKKVYVCLKLKLWENRISVSVSTDREVRPIRKVYLEYMFSHFVLITRKWNCVIQNRKTCERVVVLLKYNSQNCDINMKNPSHGQEYSHQKICKRKDKNVWTPPKAFASRYSFWIFVADTR